MTGSGSSTRFTSDEAGARARAGLPSVARDAGSRTMRGDAMERIGFVGLGRMGRPMAANLLTKGFALMVHDIDPREVRALVELGTSAAADERRSAATAR
jgi:phosphoglycerate dehydrogenase-like enzyme